MAGGVTAQMPTTVPHCRCLPCAQTLSAAFPAAWQYYPSPHPCTPPASVPRRVTSLNSHAINISKTSSQASMMEAIKISGSADNCQGHQLKGALLADNRAFIDFKTQFLFSVDPRLASRHETAVPLPRAFGFAGLPPGTGDMALPLPSTA